MHFVRPTYISICTNEKSRLGVFSWIFLQLVTAKIRGGAASLVTASNWASTFAVTSTFIFMKNKLGMEGAFWIYSVFCLFGILFTYLCVPETRHKSLEDIELLWGEEEEEPVVPSVISSKQREQKGSIGTMMPATRRNSSIVERRRSDRYSSISSQARTVPIPLETRHSISRPQPLIM